jgi:hypothetical protein
VHGTLHTAKLYTAPYWASPNSFSSAVPSVLHCTLWAMLHPTELRLHSIELYHALISYTAPCWAVVQPAELPSSELRCTSWAMLHLIEPWGTLLSYGAPHWAMLYLLSFAAPYWAKVHPAELHSTLTELRCTLLSYAEPYLVTLYPTELRCSLLRYAAPCKLYYSLTELPSVLVPLCNFVKCRSVRYWNTLPVRYRNARVPDWDARCWQRHRPRCRCPAMKTINTAPTILSAIQAISQSTFINEQLYSTCDQLEWQK